MDRLVCRISGYICWRCRHRLCRLVNAALRAWHAASMNDVQKLLREAIELVRERPCHREECIAGELTDPSHRLCQRIRSFIPRAEAALR